MNTTMTPTTRPSSAEDQPDAQLLDVLAEAHRRHGLFFGEEILVGRHGGGPPERGRDGDRRRRRVAEETRVATASPEAGTLAGGTARRPRRDGRARGGVPAPSILPARPAKSTSPDEPARSGAAISGGQPPTAGVTTKPTARRSDDRLRSTRMDVRGATTWRRRRSTRCDSSRSSRELIWGGRRLGTVLHKPLGAGVGLRRELGDLRLSRRGQRRQRRPAGRDDACASWSGSRPLELLGPGRRAARPVPAAGQVHRRPPGPLGPGPPRRRERPPAGRRQRQDRGLGDPRTPSRAA